MGRGRGKGKKQTVITHEDPGSDEEEKIPAHRRRGRPQKPLKDNIGEEKKEAVKFEGDDGNANGSISNKNMKNQTATENGRKRNRSTQDKENIDSVKEENGTGIKSSTDDSAKSVGYRQNGSRRKNKPRRAAEVGVECN